MNSANLRLKVMVATVWNHVNLELDSHTTIRDLKVTALAEAGVGSVDITSFEVKFRGALVLDETQTLAQLEVPSGASLIVLSARRSPVR
ncbi:MAG: hypothetical protein ACE5FJ_01950 [Gemmatimonadales bacterium]